MSEAATAAPQPPTLAHLVDRLVKVRNKKAEIEKRHKTEIAPYNEMLARLEAAVIDGLNAAGATSVKTPSGTAYTATRTSAKVVDWPLALGYIRAHGAWELLEARVSKTGVEALLAETGNAMPGVAMNRELTLHIRTS